ncbi:hypothetical protein [Streptomyces sp. NPDC007355]|uniref:hypothetical protein n=1 Tax=Streptomyces sp. NPDC007355 TaxID=3364778 RepID=UPI00367A67C6
MDPYETTRLWRGSCYRVPNVALARMHAEGRLEVVGKAYGTYRVRVLDPAPRDDVEAMLLDVIGGEEGTLPAEQSWDEKRTPCLVSLHERLVLDGLLREPGLPERVSASSPAVACWKAEQHRVRRLRNAAVVILSAAAPALALITGAWLPLAAQASALSLASIRHARRPRQSGGVTELGEAAVKAATSGEVSKEDRLLRSVMTYGFVRLPKKHPLKPAPAPPSSPPPPREPDPPRQDFNFDSPGLGGL